MIDPPEGGFCVVDRKMSSFKNVSISGIVLVTATSLSVVQTKIVHQHQSICQGYEIACGVADPKVPFAATQITFSGTASGTTQNMSMKLVPDFSGVQISQQQVEFNFENLRREINPYLPKQVEYSA